MPSRISPSTAQTGRNFLGPWLKILREERGETITGLASRLQRAGWDVSRPVLSYVESGKRSLSDSELFLVLCVLGCSLEDLQPAFEVFSDSLKKKRRKRE